MDMPTSYDGTLLDHLAEHMVYLSAASSFWFSINSSYDHDCHLSKRLGMTPQDYEYLLVAANLAQFHPKWVFSIKILKWKLFLKGHQFLTINCMGTMEVSSKKLNLNAYSLRGISSQQGWLLHSLPSHSPLVVSSRPPLVLLSCRLVFESPIVARPSCPLVTPPSRLLAALAGCRIASRRPFVAPPSHRLIVPDGCCIDSRRAAVSSTVPHSWPSNAPPTAAIAHRLHRPPPPPPPPPAALSNASPSCIDKESSSSLLPPPPHQKPS
jgi:hypothetical protein